MSPERNLSPAGVESMYREAHEESQTQGRPVAQAGSDSAIGPSMAAVVDVEEETIIGEESE
jgi:hypothetical protein